MLVAENELRRELELALKYAVGMVLVKTAGRFTIVRFDRPDGGLDVGMVGGSAAPLTPSSSSSSRLFPYSTPKPGDDVLRWMEALLATEFLVDSVRDTRLALSENWSLRSTSGSGVRVSRASESRMEEMTCGLAALALTRLAERLLGGGRRWVELEDDSALESAWCRLSHGSDASATAACGPAAMDGRVSTSIRVYCRCSPVDDLVENDYWKRRSLLQYASLPDHHLSICLEPYAQPVVGTAGAAFPAQCETSRRGAWAMCLRDCRCG